MPRIYAESGGMEGGISVERLTYRDANGEAWYSDAGTEADRLHFIADMEDILGGGYDLDRLRELAQADREGRCVVIPFKPPRWVYMCSERFPKPGEAYYASTINVLQDMEKGCVFGDTPEEAEAALKGDQHG